MKEKSQKSEEPIFTTEDMRDYLSEELKKYENLTVMVNGSIDSEKNGEDVK